MPKLILGDSPFHLPFNSPYISAPYTITLQLFFAKEFLNNPNGNSTFSPQRLPNSADLAFIKNVVSVLRSDGGLKLAQTRALNQIASALGHKHYASLQARAKSELQDSSQRCEKLPGIFFWVLTTLRPLDKTRDAETSSREMIELFRKAIEKPVFFYKFSDKNRDIVEGTISIFPTGILLHRKGGVRVFHDIHELSLLAIDYEVKESSAPLIAWHIRDKEISNKQIIINDRSSEQSWLMPIQGSEFALTMFDTDGISHQGYISKMEAGDIMLDLFDDQSGQLSFFSLESSHLTDLFGHIPVTLAIPQKENERTLRTCRFERSDVTLKSSSSPGIYPDRETPSKNEIDLWYFGLNAPTLYGAQKNPPNGDQLPQTTQ